MGKMSGLELQVKELRSCAKTIIGIADALTEIFSSAADETPPEKPARKQQKAEPPKEEPKPLKLTEVRHRMTLVAQAGYSEEVKALITKYGARKLSEVAPEKFSDLLKEAEALGKPEAGTDG